MAAQPSVLPSTPVIPSLSRANFPEDFIFGASAAAYQYEGATSEEFGKGDSIWDKFIRDHPEMIFDGKHANVAVDFYHKYKEDVQLMKEIGLDAFRFSISWSRILPKGTTEEINEKGIEFYKQLIKELKDNDIEPVVTLLHWDVPQALYEKYGGFLSEDIVDDFRNYAELCFQRFGADVKYWCTMNEPFCLSYYGHGTASQAPGRSTPNEENVEPFTIPYRCPYRTQCTNTQGDSAREPYIVTHNQLLAHAAVVKLYRDNYKTSEEYQIGISLVAQWMMPKTDSSSDIEAAKRAFDFFFGWFMEPLTTGYYPKRMKDIVKDRLPDFNDAQREMLIGSYDFLDLHYYTAQYVSDSSDSKFDNESVMTDPHIVYSVERYNLKEDKKEIIGEQAGSQWLRSYPKGVRELLNYVHNNYNQPIIYIMENGFSENNDNVLSVDALSDIKRINFHYQHLSNIEKAINEDKIKVKGFFVWSLLDNFEWGDGYSVRFGLFYVDYKDNLKRIPKLSATWYKTITRK